MIHGKKHKCNLDEPRTRRYHEWNQRTFKFQSSSNCIKPCHNEAHLPLREVGIFSGINITPESILTDAKKPNLEI